MYVFPYVSLFSRSFARCVIRALLQPHEHALPRPGVDPGESGTAREVPDVPVLCCPAHARLVSVANVCLYLYQ